MPETGIPVSDNCMTKFQEMQMRNAHRYMVFSIQNNNKIDVEIAGDSEAEFEDLLNKLPENDCRYAVIKKSFDVPSTVQGLNEGTRTKTVFILWAPSAAGIKSKFIYSASKESLKQKLGGLVLEIQAGNKTSFSEQQVLDKCLSTVK